MSGRRSRSSRWDRIPWRRPPCPRRPVPGRSWPGPASGRRAPREKRRDEVPRCRPCAERGRPGHLRSRTNGSSPRCPTPGRGRGPPCSLGRAHVPARRRVSSSARAPTVLLVRSGANRVTGPTHHLRTPGHRLRRTMRCFPAAYGGVAPLRARLRYAGTSPMPGGAPLARGIPGSLGTTTPHVPSPDPRAALRRFPPTVGSIPPPPPSAGSRRRCGGGLRRDLRLARLHGIDRLVGLGLRGPGLLG
jgi:hypothetical protein